MDYHLLHRFQLLVAELFSNRHTCADLGGIGATALRKLSAKFVPDELIEHAASQAKGGTPDDTNNSNASSDGDDLTRSGSLGWLTRRYRECGSIAGVRMDPRRATGDLGGAGSARRV